MPRFDKLEFDHGEPPPKAKGTAEPAGKAADAPPPRRAESRPARVDTDWLKQADEARRNGSYESALKFYSRALEKDKSLVAGWLGQVQMLIQLEEAPEAEMWSRKALELFPNHGDLMAGRAQAFCRIGDLRQAFALSDGAMKQPGQSAYRWMVRGEIMAASGEPTGEACLDKALQQDSDWLVPMEIARSCMYHDRPTKALVFARKAVLANPNAYYAWHVQGLCEMQLGMNAQAKQSFEHCVELCPGHPDSLRQLHELRMFWPSLGRKLRRLFRRG